MYTELPHDQIELALDWILQLAEDQLHITSLAIPMKKQCLEPIRPKRINDKRFVSLSLTKLKEIVLFDLKNCYYVLGNVVLRQRKGIPMGSPLSPVLAMLICMFYEHKFINTPRNHGCVQVHGSRYVDDLLAVLVCPVHTSDDTIHHVWNSQVSCLYHSDMRLENEDFDASFDFLDATIVPSDTSFVSFLKNF